jgi:hypothetical protein
MKLTKSENHHREILDHFNVDNGLFSDAKIYFKIPCIICLTTDKKRMLLIDNVDLIYKHELSKKEAIELAEWFKAMAEEME